MICAAEWNVSAIRSRWWSSKSWIHSTGRRWGWSAARRSRWRTRCARPARSVAQRRPARARPRVRRVVDCPGSRRADGPRVGPLGGGARRALGTHGPNMKRFRARLAATGHPDGGPGAAGRRQPRAQRYEPVPSPPPPPRRAVLLGDAPAAKGETAPRPRAVRLLPVRRRHRRRARTASAAERERALADFGDRFFEDLQLGRSSDAVLKAVVHTVKAFDIDPTASGASCAR